MNTPSSHRTILVVEADELLRTILKKELEKGGWQVTVAVDQEDALAKLMERKVDRLYINCYPKSWEGMGLLRERRQSANPETPAFVLAGPAQGEIQTARALGATWVRELTDFKTKEDLVAAVVA